jgi:hypothetical protein
LIWLDLQCEVEERAAETFVAEKCCQRLQEIRLVRKSPGIACGQLSDFLNASKDPLGVGLMNWAKLFGNGRDIAC